MRALWINNVAQVLGGTLQCTASMMKALPDWDHTVYCFSGELGEEARRLFGEGVRLCHSYVDVEQAVEEAAPDIIIWQNTSADRIPDSVRHKALNVYYQHSAHGTARQARAKCHKSFAVSKWLAEKAGMPEESVLYQPVTIPENTTWTQRADRLVVGRICTPQSKKWNLDDLDKWYSPICKEFPGQVQLEFVAPEELHIEIAKRWVGTVTDRCWTPSLAARSHLHRWDVLLYCGGVEESYGRCIKEAQRCGCVPIAERRGGVVEQIEDGCGILVDHPEQVVDAIWNLGDQQYRDEMKQRCKQRGDAEGSLAVFRSRFLERLKEAA